MQEVQLIPTSATRKTIEDINKFAELAKISGTVACRIGSTAYQLLVKGLTATEKSLVRKLNYIPYRGIRIFVRRS